MLDGLLIEDIRTQVRGSWLHWRISNVLFTVEDHRLFCNLLERQMLRPEEGTLPPPDPPRPQDGWCCPHLHWVLLNTCCGNHWVDPPHPHLYPVLTESPKGLHTPQPFCRDTGSAPCSASRVPPSWGLAHHLLLGL